MTELLGECFGSKVKDVTTAVLHSCFFGAAVLPAHISMDLNELWVVYTMKDNDFFEKHLWQADRAHRSEALVYDVSKLHVLIAPVHINVCSVHCTQCCICVCSTPSNV